jgi:putative membrane protein
MKSIIRAWIFYTLAIYLIGELIAGFKISTDLRGLLISGLGLALLFHFVNPILKFLFLPINMLTLGLFSFVSQVITFYLFLRLWPDYFQIEPWKFPGYEISGLGIKIPSFAVTSLSTIILATGFISIIIAVLSRLI